MGSQKPQVTEEQVRLFAFQAGIDLAPWQIRFLTMCFQHPDVVFHPPRRHDWHPIYYYLQRYGGTNIDPL